MEEQSISGTPDPSGQRQGVRGSIPEGEEEEDEEESSSTPVTPQSALENFRRQWETELKKINVPSQHANVNSALNLVTASPSSLNNPYPNPTSMAGAVSRAGNSQEGSCHPFASAAHVNSNVDDRINSADSQGGNLQAEVPNVGPIEEQARRWFLQGVGFERHGDLYDAVRCYRRAVQLVPDIEYKISQGLFEDSDHSDNDSDTDDESIERDEESNFTDEDPVLITRFLKQIEDRGWTFFQHKTDTGKSHINDLPVEVVSYILRWVVSKELDVRSLDLTAAVCKGFYCIARDDKLWQMASERIWANCVLDSTLYNSYRDMFLRRPRVRFDGCYISKVTYIRPGEHSFQDQFYRPWHFVEYYRYFRFFPDGRVLFLTSSEEPGVSVPGLRERSPRNQATLKGTYEMYGSNIISAVVTSLPPPTSGFSNKSKRPEVQQQTSFHLEFKIFPVKGRSNWMLKWTHHAVFIKSKPNGRNINRQNQDNSPRSTVASTAFELSPTKYPPILFSRVKSYTTGPTESILE